MIYMKKWTPLVIAVCLILAGCFISALASEKGVIAIDETNFPDPEFRTYIYSMIDKDQDNVLSLQEIEQTNIIDVCYREIEDLTGIDVFWNLEKLTCSFLKGLTELDVSRNAKLTMLDCRECSLVSLTLNTALTELYCGGNRLTALDVTRNSALEILDCDDNQLTTVDIAQNPQLVYLNCSNNQLDRLDVSHNRRLIDLNCYVNKISQLDLSQNPELMYLDIYENELVSLNVTQNPELLELSCSRNQLTMLDTSQNPKLTYLSCGYNQLTLLNLSQNTALKELFCHHNHITSLDTSRSIDLEILNCASNRLTSLVVNRRLYELDSAENCLVALDLYGNTNLNSLSLIDQQSKIEVIQNAENEWELDLATVVDGWDDCVMNVSISPEGVKCLGSVISWRNQEINPVVSYRYDTRALDRGASNINPYMNVTLVLKPVVLSSVPQTGDSANPTVLLILVVGSFVAIITLLAMRRHAVRIR